MTTLDGFEKKFKENTGMDSRLLGFKPLLLR
jgi:hypothetical protein